MHKNINGVVPACVCEHIQYNPGISSSAHFDSLHCLCSLPGLSGCTAHAAISFFACCIWFEGFLFVSANSQCHQPVRQI